MSTNPRKNINRKKKINRNMLKRVNSRLADISAKGYFVGEGADKKEYPAVQAACKGVQLRNRTEIEGFYKHLNKVREAA